MTSSTLSKKYQQPPPLLLFSVAIIFLFASGNVYSQSDGAQVNKVVPIPPQSTTITMEAEIITDDSDISGKLAETYEPGTDFVLPPPANDACASATLAANVLTPGGNYKCGTTQAGSIEVGEYTGCFAPAPVSTVWYSFIATQPNMWICVKPSASVCTGTSSSFGIAVYQTNTCFPSVPAACLNYFSAPSAANIFSKINLTGLTPGSQYFIQIATWASCAGNLWKPFCIKMGVPATCTTCATNCGPMCVWAGAPPTVPDITSTCPAYGWAPPMNTGDAQTNCFSFTAVNDTVWLQQIVYSYCNPNTLSFTYNLYNVGCGLIQSGNVFVNNLITPLTVGVTYKICYTLQAACSWDSVFWPYAYTTSTTLPVEMVSFGAMPYKDKVKVYWSTASEENAKEYIIERTRNASEFIEIARIKAAGNSTCLLNYKGYDDAPLPGNNYYRLKQVDLNGKFTYTKLVSANFSTAMTDVSVVPNPAKDKATVSFSASGTYPVLLRVSDMQGKTVLKKQFESKEGINEYSLNTQELGKGIYSVQLIVDDQNTVTKLAKD